MAGHSKFSNIKHRKGSQDAKRSKVFTKLAREIMVASSSGQPDPNFNPRLRNAIITAKRSGLPKDRIETAIKKGNGEINAENYEEIRYEGYGNGGIAIIVEGLTDNRNRTASELRTCFNKSGGSLGENGSVSFMFDYTGVIEYEKSVTSENNMLEISLENGAEDVESTDEVYEITCKPEQFGNLRDSLNDKFGDPKSLGIIWVPKDPTILDLEKSEKILKLVDALEDCDDVQNVYGNFIIPDEILQQL